jgi:hypothetical protein
VIKLNPINAYQNHPPQTKMVPLLITTYSMKQETRALAISAGHNAHLFLDVHLGIAALDYTHPVSNFNPHWFIA